jgi:hypothetical protein
LVVYVLIIGQNALIEVEISAFFELVEETDGFESTQDIDNLLLVQEKRQSIFVSMALSITSKLSARRISLLSDNYQSFNLWIA